MQDMGIIAATKSYYRRRFFEVRVSTMFVADTLHKQAKERKVVSGTIGRGRDSGSGVERRHACDVGRRHACDHRKMMTFCCLRSRFGVLALRPLPCLGARV